MKKHTIIYTRDEGLKGITMLGVLVLEAAPVHTYEIVLEKFEAACTEWLNTTGSGRDSWLDSSRDYNIGDFVMEGIETRPEFLEIAEKHGVEIYSAMTYGPEHNLPYDRILNREPEEFQEEEG